MMKQIRSQEKLIAEVEAKIGERLAPYEKEAELLQSIPGVGNLSAAAIIAEIGRAFAYF